MSDEEKLISWEDEARGVINDVKNLVSSIDVSSSLEPSERFIFLNIKTLERVDYCVELSGLGFRVVGEKFDDNCLDTEEYFDTPYSLLSSISPGYKHKFASSLLDKLNGISNESQD